LDEVVVSSPEPASSTSLQRGVFLRRNLALDVTAAVGIGVTFSLVTALLAPIGRRAGMDPLGLAMLGAAPFIANALGMLAGRWGARSQRQLAAIRATGAILIVSLVLAPFPLAMIAAASAYWVTMSFGMPFQARLWGEMYPSRLRGRLLGLIGTARGGAGAIAVFLAGLVAVSLGDVPALALIGVIGIVTAIAWVFMRAPNAADPPKFSARGSLRLIRENPSLRNTLLAQGFYGGGLIAAAPLYALVQVDRLHLSLAEVGFIGLLAAASNTISYLAWGTLTDRRGGPIVLGVASAFGFVSLAAWAVAPQVSVLYIAAITGGIAGAGIDLGLQSAMITGVPTEERGAVMAGWNALTGLRGAAAPFIATLLVQFGVLSVTGALVGCAIVTAIGVALYLRDGFPLAVPAHRPRLLRRAAFLRA
jgi:MFS family permease